MKDYSVYANQPKWNQSTDKAIESIILEAKKYKELIDRVEPRPVKSFQPLPNIRVIIKVISIYPVTFVNICLFFGRRGNQTTSTICSQTTSSKNLVIL